MNKTPKFATTPKNDAPPTPAFTANKGQILLFLDNSERPIGGMNGNCAFHKAWQKWCKPYPTLFIADPLYDDMGFIDIGRLDMNGYRKCGVHYGITSIVFGPPEFHRFKTEPTERHFWVKPMSTKNTTKRCSRFVEMISIWNNTGVFNAKDLHWSDMTGVHFEHIETKPIHPFQKPLALIEKLIRLYSNPGDYIGDCCMGSGTTCLAAINTGRKFIGFERDPQCFAVAKKRILARLGIVK
jgi:hypothetical protein